MLTMGTTPPTADELRRAAADLAAIHETLEAAGLVLVSVAYDLAAASRAEAARLKAARSTAPAPKRRKRRKTTPARNAI